MRDAPAYCIAALAVLVSFLALGLAIEAHQGDPVLETREQIYSCMIDRYWEDGSSLGADAEAAVECMKTYDVYEAFIADYR